MDADLFVATLQTWLETSNRYSMRTFLRQARESKFSMSHLGALFYIHRCGSCGVTEVGDHLGVTSAAASQLLERLVEQGLVVREEDPDDRRVKRIELTEKGKQAFEAIVHAREGWMHDVALMLSSAEKEAITSALNLLISKVILLNQDVPAVS
jgi:DNA-binding MarR family transcriptional regulator